MDQTSRRKFLIGAGATGVTALAGCGGSNSNNNAGGGSSGSTTTTSSGGSSGGKTQISFWHAMGGSTAKLIQSMVSDYEQQNGDVKISVSSKNSYRDVLNSTISAVQAGKPPAVAQIFDIGTAETAQSGAFEVMEDIIPSSKLNKSGLISPVKQFYTLNGKLNSMPFNSSNAVLYINEDAFKKAGLDPSNPPKTYADIRSAAQKLVNTNTTSKGISFANHSWFVEQWFAEQNETFVNHNNGRTGTRPTKSHIDTDAGKTIFDWWHGLYKDGLYLNPGVEAWSKAKQAFLSEKVGMLITSTASVSSVTAGGKKQGFTVSTADLPVPKGERKGVVVGGASLWVPKGLSNAQKNAAADFVAWLSQPTQQVRWHKNTGYFPVRTQSVNTLKSNGWFDQHPNFKVAFDQLQATESTYATQGAALGPFPKTRTIVENAFVSTTQGTSVDSALSNAESKIDQAIKNYNQSN